MKNRFTVFANRRKGCTMVPFSRSKTKFRKLAHYRSVSSPTVRQLKGNSMTVLKANRQPQSKRCFTIILFFCMFAPWIVVGCKGGRATNAGTAGSVATGTSTSRDAAKPLEMKTTATLGKSVTFTMVAARSWAPPDTKFLLLDKVPNGTYYYLKMDGLSVGGGHPSYSRVKDRGTLHL